jgi:hypothetical protein
MLFVYVSALPDNWKPNPADSISGLDSRTSVHVSALPEYHVRA